MALAQSVDSKEIGHFSKDAARWWDEAGPFAPLHKLNPARLAYIKERICAAYGRDVKGFDSLKGLKILDIGCGGGLVCEPLARLGGDVIGIDADEQAIDVAREHAGDLKIDYRAGAAEDVTEKFDVVLALEIIEHVNAPAEFVKTCAKLVKPDGIIIFSTLNRTAKSFALGIMAAEYILRWVPRGTHNWKKFVRPSELANALRKAGLTPQDVRGLVYNPLKSDFSLSQHDIDVNYFITANKAGCPA